MSKNWPILNEELVYNGYRKIIRRTYQLPDGQIADFDLIKGHQVVCILPITSDNKIVLAKQFRPGPALDLLELPGGAIEEGEDPAKAAARELAEETGYQGQLQLVAHTPVDAYNTAWRYHFVATECQPTGHLHNDEHEFTEAALMTLEQFKQHLHRGQLTDMATGFLGLDFLHL